MANRHGIVVMGERGVGKSAVCVRYDMGHFVENYDPTIEESMLKTVTMADGTALVVELLEVHSGADMFQAMGDLYIKNAAAFVLLYDVSRAETLMPLLEAIERIKRIRGAAAFPLVVAGNKADLAAEGGAAGRAVAHTDGEALAFGALPCFTPFFEVSAKTGANVVEAFEAAARLFWERREPEAGKKKGK